MVMQLNPNNRARLIEARAYFEQTLKMQPQFFVARRELQELNEVIAKMHP